ncbi:MAG TPA: SRPBCC family protein [Acidimicrobiales bacterium]|nr:SRPBCC family protein [Acidimicrobiales bacterium]
MTTARGSVRSEVRLPVPADDVWALVGDPARLAEWFPGIASCTVEGDVRTVMTGSGLPMPERILTVDRLQRRFQYRITVPVFKEHTSTLDVHDLGDGTSLVVYSVDAEPSIMALVIGGAAGAALDNLRHVLKADDDGDR